MSVVSRAGRCEIVSSARSSLAMRYTTTRAESRLMCLSRRAQISSMPTTFGLAPVSLEETQCVARGNPCCEYHLRWKERTRWHQPILGVVLGAAICGASAAAGVETVVLSATLPVLCGALAWARELHQTSLSNLRAAEEMTEALHKMAEETNQAREEALSFSQRQEEWARLLEQQVEERTATLRSVVARIHELREQQIANLQSLSHDLRNPLTMLRLQHHLLKKQAADREQVLDDMGRALDQVDSLLAALLASANAESSRPPATERMETARLVERLRRRLKALVYGRDIRIAVLLSRGTPETVEVDRLVFDRIADNLLTNAAKYSERGSIIVELGCESGMLVVKVSDTGVGISRERLERVFIPGAERDRSSPNSAGIGLSSVVTLLSQARGRLEVMSRPGSGTTFWAYLPTQPAESRETETVVPGGMDGMVGRVVKIRPSA
ncbi:MAG: ATP-binding protein [Myxococcales bacterium]